MSQTERADKHEEKRDEEIKTERSGEAEAGIKGGLKAKRVGFKEAKTVKQ